MRHVQSKITDFQHKGKKVKNETKQYKLCQLSVSTQLLNTSLMHSLQALGLTTQIVHHPLRCFLKHHK